MKKMLIVLLAFFVAIQTVGFGEYWKAKNSFYKFDFNKSEFPEYKEIFGEWEIQEAIPQKSLIEGFEKEKIEFSPVFGSWSVEEGVYVQGEEIASATTRSVIGEAFENFSLNLDVFPKSEENTLMIYFGYESEEKFQSVEINSYQSKLILNGAEEVGKGSILKDKAYNVKLELVNGVLTLYCDNEAIFQKDGLEGISGKVGIGTWNSIIGFDNFNIEEVSEMGNDNKLTNMSNEKSLLVFEDLSGEDFTVSVPMAAKRIHSGEIGIGVRLDENHDGYYIGLDKNGIYISKQENGKKTVKARREMTFRSEKFYELSAICDGEKIIALIDGEEVVSINDSGFSSGIIGIFADGTGIFCTNVTMKNINAEFIEDEESDWKLYDVEKRGSVGEKLILKLGLLKTYEDGSFRGEKHVTNGEFFEAVSLISGIEKNELVNVGYIKNEMPADEALSAEDFVFAMVRLLGIKDENYPKAASDAGILKGVSFEGGYVSRESFANCLYNTLLADKMSLSAFEGDKLVFEKNTNLLEEVFKIKELVGIVEADSTAYIKEKITLPEKTTLIGGIEVSGVENTKDYIGKNVRAYVKFDEESENYAEAVLVEEYKNDVTKATSEFIDGATTSAKLVWLDAIKEKFKSEEIPGNAAVIHNGSTMGKASEQEWSLFTPSDGEVNLIDNNNDGDVDVVVIWDYITYVVEYVNVKNKMIFDKTGKEAISLEDRKYTLTDKNGEGIALDEIKPFDVLSVACVAENDELIIRKAAAEPVVGTYRRDGYTIWVGNDNYSICGTGALNGAGDNDSVKVYLDIYDRAAFVVRQSVYEYSYLSKSTYSDDGGENVIYLKMFSFDGGAVKKELADTVTVQFAGGKTKYYKNKVKDNSFKVLYELIKNRQELVKVRENAEGKIRDIIFPRVKMGQNYPDTTADFDIYYGWEEADTFATKHAKFLQNAFESRYRVTGDTKILSLEGNPNEPERFKRISVSELVADNDYSILVYDVNEKFEAGAIVIYRIEDWYSRFGSVVGSVEKAANQDGDEIMKLVVYTLGEEQVLYADNKELTSDGDVVQHFANEGVKLGEIVPGDVIYYLLGNDGMISGFAVLHKNKQGQQFYHRSNYGWGSTYIPNAAMTVTYCEVLKVYGDLIVADIDGAKPINENVWRNYYIYEKGRNRLRKAERNDVKPGDKIVGLWKWSNMNDLIIYR